MENETVNVKQLAAEKAVQFVSNGDIVGLGTGSTANYAIMKLGERVKEGLQINAVATSHQSEKLAKENGIPLIPFSEVDKIDVAIDGADEVDDANNLIKGGGGALMREKIIAGNSKRFIVIVDESKLVSYLGSYPLPVEILPFAFELTIKRLKELHCKVLIRQKDNKDFITENGNLIADCFMQKITHPEALNVQLHLIPGVLETGLFINTMVHSVIVGCKDGLIKILNKEV